MRQALELARASVGLASPNPQVGCVLVRDGAVVGEGAHFYDEFDHAEICRSQARRGTGSRGDRVCVAGAVQPLGPNGAMRGRADCGGSAAGSGGYARSETAGKWAGNRAGCGPLELK